jgi:hypothetical protein
MKLLRIITLLTFLLPFNIFGQEASSSLDSNWLKLMRPIKLRSETINTLIRRLYPIKEIPAKDLKTLAGISDNVYGNIQIKIRKDSITINLLNSQNNQLTIALSRIYVFLESSKKASKDNKIMNLMAQIEACENRIYFARREYNESCRDLNRMDLKFDLSEQPPKVVF